VIAENVLIRQLCKAVMLSIYVPSPSLQIDFQANQFALRVITPSQGTTAGNVNRPPGIAVNMDDVDPPA
jgi:hypothetical protein